MKYVDLHAKDPDASLDERDTAFYLALQRSDRPLTALEVEAARSIFYATFVPPVAVAVAPFVAAVAVEEQVSP